MSAGEQGDTPQRIELRNDLAELYRLNEFVRRIAQREKLDPALQFALDLCLEEAVTNILTHGSISSESETPISVTLVSSAPTLTICLEDEGRAFDPTSAAPPPVAISLADAQIGGQGIPLMRKMASSMSYERRDGRNRLVLCFGPPAVKSLSQSD